MADNNWRVSRSKTQEVNRAMKEQIQSALDPILYGDSWESHKVVIQFEEQFCNEMGYAYTSAVQSGAAGLLLALRACGVGPGDEVITVANSDISTTASISHCGATPVLCDIQDKDHTIHVDLIKSLITDRTRAILPVDLYGHPADVKRMREIAQRHGLYIIEDACLAAGAEDYGRPVGYFADIAVHSTNPSKPFPSASGGGLVVTDNTDLWKAVQTLKGYGRRAEENIHVPVRYDHVREGYNLDMTPFDAAILMIKLPYLKEWSDKRRQIGSWYYQELRNISEVTLPVFRPESSPIYRTFTICSEQRDKLHRFLKERGVQTALHYVPPVHLQTVYQGRNLPGSDRLPVTEYLSGRVLGLPVDPGHTQADIAYVCEQIRDFFCQ